MKNEIYTELNETELKQGEVLDEEERDEKESYQVIKSFFIAGVKFHKMKNVINEMEEGDNLLLAPEPENRFDSNAIRIEFVNLEDKTMLGYVPAKFSAEISALIDLEENISCVITKLNKEAKPWERCKVEIRELI